MTSPTPPPDPRAAGERIEALLEASSAGGAVARERAEELVRLVVELYGAGLERVLEIVDETRGLDDATLEKLSDDELVSSLLLVHGLHPFGVEERVERALEKVRPYLGSHGGDVELIGVTEEGVVQLRMKGSCDGCPSSSVTLKLAVEGAIEAAAPDIAGIDVEAASTSRGGSTTVIPVDNLTVRLRSAEPSGGSWEPIPGIDEIPPGGVRRITVAGVDVAVCKVGTDVYAYRDACPACRSSLAGASVERSLGSRAAVLTCPRCRSHYDVRQAGRGLDADERHLAPLPLLERDGVAQIALPAPVPA